MAMRGCQRLRTASSALSPAWRARRTRNGQIVAAASQKRTAATCVTAATCSLAPLFVQDDVVYVRPRDEDVAHHVLDVPALHHRSLDLEDDPHEVRPHHRAVVPDVVSDGDLLDGRPRGKTLLLGHARPPLVASLVVVLEAEVRDELLPAQVAERVLELHELDEQ